MLLVAVAVVRELYGQHTSSRWNLYARPALVLLSVVGE